MTENEKKLLISLVLMVRQYLDRYDDQIDSLAESAGEHAIQALADFGLMEAVNTRFGRWTEAGKQFLEEAGIRDPKPVDYPGRIVGRSEPKK